MTQPVSAIVIVGLMIGGIISAAAASDAQLSPQQVTGGGQIHLAGDDTVCGDGQEGPGNEEEIETESAGAPARSTFGFNARLKSGLMQGMPLNATGHLNYINHFTGVHLNCSVTEIASIGETVAMFSGTCQSNLQPLPLPFTACVEDHGEPGKDRDEFEISYGAAEGAAIRVGNIQIHR